MDAGDAAEGEETSEIEDAIIERYLEEEMKNGKFRFILYIL